MTIEELARAMEKDIGGSDNFVRKNMENGIPGIFICNETKTFKDENQADGLKDVKSFQYFSLQVTNSIISFLSLCQVQFSKILLLIKVEKIFLSVLTLLSQKFCRLQSKSKECFWTEGLYLYLLTFPLLSIIPDFLFSLIVTISVVPAEKYLQQ